MGRKINIDDVIQYIVKHPDYGKGLELEKGLDTTYSFWKIVRHDMFFGEYIVWIKADNPETKCEKEVGISSEKFISMTQAKSKRLYEERKKKQNKKDAINAVINTVLADVKKLQKLMANVEEIKLKEVPEIDIIDCAVLGDIEKLQKLLLKEVPEDEEVAK